MSHKNFMNKNFLQLISAYLLGMLWVKKTLVYLKWLEQLSQTFFQTSKIPRTGKPELLL